MSDDTLNSIKAYIDSEKAYICFWENCAICAFFSSQNDQFSRMADHSTNVYTPEQLVAAYNSKHKFGRHPPFVAETYSIKPFVIESFCDQETMWSLHPEKALTTNIYDWNSGSTLGPVSPNVEQPIRARLLF